MIEEGLLRDIPIIGSIAAIGRTGLMLRERIFVKKLLSFLIDLDDISDADRAEFQKKVESDQALANRVGETLLSLLDKFDTTDKCKLLARLFTAYLGRKIVFEEFMRYSSGLVAPHLTVVRYTTEQ